MKYDTPSLKTACFLAAKDWADFLRTGLTGAPRAAAYTVLASCFLMWPILVYIWMGQPSHLENAFLFGETAWFIFAGTFLFSAYDHLLAMSVDRAESDKS